MDIVNDLCNERDSRLIQQIPLPSISRMDSWYWLLDSKGEFTVRSCYRKIRGESGCQEGGFWKKLWNLQLPGKIVKFLWRACQNVLPTMAELVKKQVEVSMLCGWCNLHVEEAVHTLFTCSFARTLWAEEGLQELSNVDAGMKVKDILKREFMGGNRERWAKIGLLCWGLWTRRNTWVWEKKPLSVFGVRSMAMSLLQEWQQSRENAEQGNRRLKQQGRKWCKPPEGWVKINLDAACQNQTGEIGVACVVRDDRGEFLRARSNKMYGNMQAREAEARSLKEALIWTHNWRKQKCIFELDSKLVVDAIHGDRGNSIFHAIIDDCVENLKHFEEVLVVFEYRSANNVAHLLARAAFSMSGLMEWYQTAPDFIRCNLILEAN